MAKKGEMDPADYESEMEILGRWRRAAETLTPPPPVTGAQ